MVQQMELQVYARRAALPLAMAGGMEQQSAQRPEPTPAMALQVASPMAWAQRAELLQVLARKMELGQKWAQEADWLPPMKQQQELPQPYVQQAALRLRLTAAAMKWA